MKYKKIVKGIFIDRPNRFIAHVNINGSTETVHVKNTGRCKELLIPGCTVFLSESDNPARKTKYDLIAVIKSNGLLINMDSQAPNQVVKEWLSDKNFDLVKPEHVFGNSRIDFYLEKDKRKILMEVKGCTLEKDGIGYFPDAPTERGIKHINELSQAIEADFETYLAFVIQMDGITEVRPNIITHPEFGQALELAEKQGVKIVYFLCHVEPDELVITDIIIKKPSE